MCLIQTHPSCLFYDHECIPPTNMNDYNGMGSREDKSFNIPQNKQHVYSNLLSITVLVCSTNWLSLVKFEQMSINVSMS